MQVGERRDRHHLARQETGQGGRGRGSYSYVDPTGTLVKAEISRLCVIGGPITDSFRSFHLSYAIKRGLWVA